MAINNDRSAAILQEAAELVRDANFGSGSELSMRRREGEIQAEILVALHRIEFNLKHRRLLVDELYSLRNNLDVTPSSE